MLTGKMPFQGETISDTLAAVIRTDPDWTLLPGNLPRSIRTLLLRCVHKDSRQRLQSIGEARIAIENALSANDSAAAESVPLASVPGTHPAKLPRVFLASAVAVLLLAVGFAISKLIKSAAAQPANVVRFAIAPPQGTHFSSIGAHTVAISPDGTRLVFRINTTEGPRLYLRDMSSSEMTLIPGSEGAQVPFFSPDGQSVAFVSSGTLKKTALSSGIPVPLMDSVGNEFGGVWGDDQYIYFGPGFTSPIMRVSATGGSPQPVTTVQSDKKELGHVGPLLLPGGNALLFTVWAGGDVDDGPLVAQVLATGERKVLLLNAFDPRFVPPNHLLFGRGRNLMVVGFNPETLTVSGSPVPVLQELDLRPGFSGFSARYNSSQYDVSRSGTLVYMRGGVKTTENKLVWAEQGAKPQPFPLEANVYESPRFSPDGKQIALTVRLPDIDVWIYDFQRGALRRITFAPGEDELPVWSPDGKRIAFASNGRQQAFVLPADGSGQEEPLMKNNTHFHLQSWSPDGKLIAYERLGASGRWEIWMLPMEGDHKPYPYLQGQFQERHPAFSPDGKWIAYSSGESSGEEVYVQRFPGPGEKVQVSTDGGSHPVWSRDGRRLIYESSDTLWAVDVVNSPYFSFGQIARALSGANLE